MLLAVKIPDITLSYLRGPNTLSGFERIPAAACGFWNVGMKPTSYNLKPNSNIETWYDETPSQIDNA